MSKKKLRKRLEKVQRRIQSYWGRMIAPPVYLEELEWKLYKQLGYRLVEYQ